MDRVQQRFRSRSPSFLIQVEVFKIFSQSRVPQRPSSDSPGQAGEGFFSHFSPPEKKCEDPAHAGVGTAFRTRAYGPHELSWGLGAVGYDTHGRTNVMGHKNGVRRLLLVAERQEWCFLVCSSCLPSYPVAWSSSWCRLCGGVALCQPTEAFGRIPHSR